MAASCQTATVASPPFDKTNADIILRSSDNVDFLVYKTVLGLVSPVFKDMLSMPQPSSSSAADLHGVLPFISLTESSVTLDRLMRLCYTPTFNIITDVEETLIAAQKYQMDDVITPCSKFLLSFAEDATYATYAIACRFDFEDVARAALSVYWNSKVKPGLRPLVEYVPQMNDISAGALFRLLRFCYRAQSEKEFEFTPRSTGPTPIVRRVQLTSHPFVSPSQTSDLILESTDDIHFHVTSVILAIASPILAHIVAPLDIVSDTRIVPVCTHSNMLCAILHFCYPFPDPELQDHMEEFEEFVEAAREYQVPRLTAFVKRMCVKLAETDAVQAYFVAIREGWEEEAREAAKHAVYQMRDFYVPEMEDVPAKAYHRLLVYRHRCLDVVGIQQSHWSHATSYEKGPRTESSPDFSSLQVRFAMMTVIKNPSCPPDGVIAPFTAMWRARSSTKLLGTAVTAVNIKESDRLASALSTALVEIKM